MKKIELDEKKELKTKEPKIKEHVFNTDTLIERPTYFINFVKPDNQALRNDLANTGKVFGEVINNNDTPDDHDDEVVIFVRK